MPDGRLCGRISDLRSQLSGAASQAASTQAVINLSREPHHRSIWAFRDPVVLLDDSRRELFFPSAMCVSNLIDEVGQNEPMREENTTSKPDTLHPNFPTRPP